MGNINEKDGNLITTLSKKNHFFAEQFYWIQRFLSKAQAIPLVGPLLFSPIKLLVSILVFTFSLGTYTIVAGPILAIYLLFGITKSFFLDGILDKVLKGCSFYFMIGGIGMIYSLSNFATLGILGYMIESGVEKEINKKR